MGICRTVCSWVWLGIGEVAPVNVPLSYGLHGERGSGWDAFVGMPHATRDKCMHACSRRATRTVPALRNTFFPPHPAYDFLPFFYGLPVIALGPLLLKSAIGKISFPWLHKLGALAVWKFYLPLLRDASFFLQCKIVRCTPFLTPAVEFFLLVSCTWSILQ